MELFEISNYKDNSRKYVSVGGGLRWLLTETYSYHTMNTIVTKAFLMVPLTHFIPITF